MLKKAIPYIALLIVLACLSFYFYKDTIALFPSYIHAWTQSDRFVLALAFVDNGLDLFHPQTYNLMTREGITGVDLPWHEYLIAIIMKITGNTSAFVFRFYTLLYSLLGYVFLFRLSRLLQNSIVKSLVLILFVFTLPVLVYYQAGFVPSAPALSTVFIAYYFYFRYQKDDRVKDLYLALLFFTAAALYRSPYNIFLFASLLQQGLKAIRLKKAFWSEAAAYTVSYSLIIVSTLYKTYLNTKYGSMFLTELKPAESLSHLREILSRVGENWQLEYFTKAHYILLLLSAVALIVYLIKRYNCTREKLVLSQQLILILAGAFVYFLLMAQQFIAHDYYSIDSFYPGVALLFLLGLASIPQSKGWNIIIVIIAIPMFTWALSDSKKIQEKRYTYHPWDRGEVTRRNFEGSAVFLDSIGIPRTAKILVLDAYSTNVPLILMKRKGYTVQHTLRENIEKGLAEDYDYIVIQDVFLPSDVIRNLPELTKHLKRISGNGKISIYKYSDRPLDQDINVVLNIPENAADFQLSFEIPDSLTPWGFDLTLKEDTANTNTYGVLNNDQVFGPGMVWSENPGSDKIFFSAWFNPVDPSARFEVVVSAAKQGEMTFYSSFPISFETPDKWYFYNCLFDLPDDLPEDVELKCYIYNPGGETIRMDDLEIVLY